MNTNANGPDILAIPHSTATNKAAVLAEIAAQAAGRPLLSNTTADQLEKLLNEREEVISTGVGSGVAIPHCFVEGLENFLIGLMTVESAVDFNSPDGKPVQLFFFIMGPPNRRNQHIKILSDISRAARQDAIRSALLEADNAQSLEKQLYSHLHLNPPKEKGEQCKFEVYVQQEDLFETILEEISAHTEGNIAVQELNNAGSYLNRLPLFAALWSNQEQENIRLIVAIIDKRFVNELSRRIHQLAGTKDSLEGICITVQELIYHEGNIDF